MEKLVLRDEKELHRYLSGFEMELGLTGIDGAAATSPQTGARPVDSDRAANLVQIAYRGKFLGLERVKNGKATNSFPKEWRRR